MHPHLFLDKVSDHAVAAAIAEAEKKTSGRIRVYVSHSAVDDPVETARLRFLHMRMDHIAERNGILIFVAPKSRKFAIIGDEAVHQRCGEQFWAQLVAEMGQHFKREQWTDALVHGIRRVGEILAEYFPYHV